MVEAGENLSLIGAKLANGGETKLEAEGDVTIAAVTDTYSLESWKKKKSFGGSSSVRGQTQSVTVQRSEVVSGANLSATSGSNIEVSASTLKAEGDLTLTAEGSIGLSAQADSFYEEIHKTKSGFQKGKMDSTENVVTHQVAELSAGGDLAVTAKTGDVALEATKVASTGATTISAEDGLVGMLSVTDSDFKSVQQSGSNLFWQSMAGKGHDDTTVKMVTIDAGGGLTVTAGDGVVVEYKGGKANLADTLDRLSAEPGLAWLKDMQSRNDVAWNAVAEAHKSWDYKSQGLSGPAAAMIAIAVAIATSGAGSGLGVMLGAAENSMLALGLDAAASAAVTSLASQAAISLVNNGGDLGAVFKDLGSSSALKSLATAVVTAGMLGGLNASETFNGLLTKDASLLGKLQNAAVQQLAKATIGTAADVLISGAPLDDALRSRMLSAAAGVIGEVAASEIGGAYQEATKNGVDPAEYVAHKIAHAALGCATGAIAGGDCASGAVGGAVGEIVGGIYARDEAIQEFTDELDAAFHSEKGLTQAEADQLAVNWKARGVDMAQLAGALAAFVVGKDVNTAASTAENAAKNNAIPLLIVLAPYAEAAAVYGLGVLTAFVVCRSSGNCVLPTDSTSTPQDDVVYSQQDKGDASDDVSASRPTKVPKPGISGKEGAKDIPSWAVGERPYVGESGKDFAKRLLDKKLGAGNYDKGPGSDFNKIKKYGDRAFVAP